MKRAFEIGRQAIAMDRIFAGLLAQGIGIWIGVQTFINMGVNLGLLPTKGLTLAFDELWRVGNCHQLHGYGYSVARRL